MNHYLTNNNEKFILLETQIIIKELTIVKYIGYIVKL